MEWEKVPLPGQCLLEGIAKGPAARCDGCLPVGEPTLCPSLHPPGHGADASPGLQPRQRAGSHAASVVAGEPARNPGVGEQE